ncbi:MAG: NAD-dependent epimerase/dehydratase family protein [Chloroflexota bacterium]|nr:NAD-dependent epimerase/dehydratase family protein [Chloroflexota bacterium]
MIRVAVLGANGFIGARLTEMFILNGLAEVRPIVRNYSSLARLSRFDLDARVADAFDEKAVEPALQGCDVLVHAVAGDINTVLGTLTPVYRAAEKAGVKRLVYLSSASVHGQAPQAGTDESSELSDRQALPYNNAKVQAERTLAQLRGQGDVEVVILRPGIVFGPRSSWVTRFAEDLLDGRAALLNRGQGIFNSIYVDNLVHAIYLAARRERADREVFLVGDRESVRWADLYQPIAEALGVDLADLPEGVVQEQPGHQQPSWWDRLEPVRVSKPVQGLLSIFPHRVRLAAYRAYETLLEPVADLSPLASQAAKPVLSREMAMLYACQHKLPYEKARRVLGYQPPVAFLEAMQRTIAWLAFAGYPVKEGSIETSWQR